MLRKIGLETALAALMSFGGGATAQETTLRIQTHYAPETVSGKLACPVKTLCASTNRAL